MRVVITVIIGIAAVAGAQQLGPVMQFDAPLPWVSARNQETPAVAAVDGGYVVVWQDDRNARNFDLFIARLDAAGRSLVGRSVPLLERSLNQTQAAIAMGDRVLLVAALDQTTCAEVIAFTVDPDTLASQTAPQLLTPAQCVTDRPTIAWNAQSSRFLVVWGRHGVGAELHGSLFDSTGTVLVPNFVIASAANSAWAPDITAQGRDFVVTWTDDRLMSGRGSIFLTTVSETGAVGTSVGVELSTAAQGESCVEVTPRGLFVGWAEASVLRGAWPPSGSLALGAGSRTSCAPHGNDVVMAYETLGGGRPVVGALRVTDGGVEHFGVGLSSGTWGRVSPRLVVAADRAFVAVTGTTTYVGGNDVVGRAIDLAPDASVYDAGVVTLSTSAATQDRVTAAFDGTRYLVAWNDYSRFSSYEAIGQLVESGTGRWLAGDAGLTLSVTSHNLASYPMLGAVPDAGFFMSWGDVGSGGALDGRTISGTGALGGWQRINDLSSYVNTHVTVGLSSSYMTVFLRSDAVRLRRSALSGARLQGETVITPTAAGANQLAAAALNDVVLTVFAGGDSGVNLHALRIDSDGGQVDPTQIIVSAAPGTEADPAVAAGVGQWLVAWSRPQDGGVSSPREVYAARVSADGTVLDAPVLLGPGSQPTIAWWGGAYLVAWVATEDVVGRHVGADGVAAPATLQLAPSPEFEQRPRLTAGPPGELLLTWERYVNAAPAYAFRAHGRLLSMTLMVDAGAQLDAGIDAGVAADAGSFDAGLDDAGLNDGGSMPDAGLGDGGLNDGGSMSDAGLGDGDAGASDGGTASTGPDGGSMGLDASVALDGGQVPFDGGPLEATLRPREFGIGCATADGALLLPLLALWFSRRRR